MPYTRLRFHIVFATKRRVRWIWPEVEEFLYPVMVRLTKRAGGHSIRLGGDRDHVHQICALEPKQSISDFIERLKSESSQAVRGRFSNLWGFKWQKGYGAFTLNPLDMARVVSYVENQKEHHRTGDLWAPYEKMDQGTSNAREHEGAQKGEFASPIIRDVRTRVDWRQVPRMWGPCAHDDELLACPAKEGRFDHPFANAWVL